MAQKDKTPSFEDTSAADEPTAMWDADALKDLGLEEASKQHVAKVESTDLDAPVTQPVVKARPKTVPKKTKSAAQEGVSLPMLLAIAIALGIAVYFGVSLVLG